MAMDSPERGTFKNTVENLIRLGVLLLLGVWCFDIVRPFVAVIAWGLIIAIALAPAFEQMQVKFGGRRRLAAMVMTLALLLILISPALSLVGTLVDGSQTLAHELRDGKMKIPPPPDGVRTWPLVGTRLFDLWSAASDNLSDVLQGFKPQLQTLSKWLLSTAASAGFAILTFVLAIIIAGVLLANGERRERAVHLVFTRLAGDAGERYLNLVHSTIRSVAQGILGVALIQSILAGMGFLAAGIPGAGMLAVITLFLCVVQLGPALILLPTIIYMFATTGTVTAFVYLGWCVFVALIDNVLKPILLARGVDVPVLVVFMGAIGGFLSMGIIGLFVGSMVLVLGYTLMSEWIKGDTTADTVNNSGNGQHHSPG